MRPIYTTTVPLFRKDGCKSSRELNVVHKYGCVFVSIMRRKSHEQYEHVALSIEDLETLYGQYHNLILKQGVRSDRSHRQYSVRRIHGNGYENDYVFKTTYDREEEAIYLTIKTYYRPATMFRFTKDEYGQFLRGCLDVRNITVECGPRDMVVRRCKDCNCIFLFEYDRKKQLETFDSRYDAPQGQPEMCPDCAAKVTKVLKRLNNR